MYSFQQRKNYNEALLYSQKRIMSIHFGKNREDIEDYLKWLITYRIVETFKIWFGSFSKQFFVSFIIFKKSFILFIYYYILCFSACSSIFLKEVKLYKVEKTHLEIWNPFLLKNKKLVLELLLIFSANISWVSGRIITKQTDFLWNRTG